jgi:methylphosphotriester-DNA--protein-cysteine methyltransferase
MTVDFAFSLIVATGVDRFRLTRAFKAAYGLAPHAYLE